MRKSLFAMLFVYQSIAHAQLDRAGNVIEEGGSAPGLGFIVVSVLTGAVIGMIYAKYQQAKGKECATDGLAVIGGLVGLFAGPMLAILLK